MIEDLDMKQNSRRAWKILKNLSNAPKEINKPVTANEIVLQLLLNGKSKCRTRSRKLLTTVEANNVNKFLEVPFGINELNAAINLLK